MREWQLLRGSKVQLAASPKLQAMWCSSTCLFALARLLAHSLPQPPAYLETMHSTAPGMMRLEEEIGGGEKYSILSTRWSLRLNRSNL